jgi:hypothetical protein
MTDAVDPELRLEPEDSAPETLAGRAAIQAMSLRLAEQARREVLMLTRDLDPAYYDRPEFIEALRRLALSAPRPPIRILVREARAAVARGNRLIALARQLTSAVAIRRLGENDRDRPDAFLVADATGYCRRPIAEVHEAVASLDTPREARLLRAEFESLWEQADEDTELRRLYL